MYSRNVCVHVYTHCSGMQSQISIHEICNLESVSRDYKDFEPQKFGAIQYMYIPLCTCRFGGRHSMASHLEIMELSLTSGVVSTELLSQTTQRRMSMLALTSSTLW